MHFEFQCNRHEHSYDIITYIVVEYRKKYSLHRKLKIMHGTSWEPSKIYECDKKDAETCYASRVYDHGLPLLHYEPSLS